MAEEHSYVQKTTVSQAVDIAMSQPNDIPIMIWGPPGCGKTKSIQGRAKQDNKRVLPVLAGQSEPTDIAGIPYNYKDQYSKYVPPYWGFYASDSPNVPKEWQGDLILFFDDIVTAHEQTQAAFYKLIDEKHLGEYTLRENVKIIAAGNRLDDMSAVQDMPKALCNRFFHMYVEPNYDEWAHWAQESGIHPHVLFFLRQRQTYLTTFEDAKKATDIHAWATPRTWEMLSRSLYALEESGLRENDGEGDHEFMIIQGCIGTLATEFQTAVRDNYVVVPIKEIIANPKTAEVPDAAEMDKLWATVCNLEHWFREPKNHEKYYQEYIIYSLRIRGDIQFLLVRHLLDIMKKSPKLKVELPDDKYFDKVLAKWAEKLNMFS